MRDHNIGNSVVDLTNDNVVDLTGLNESRSSQLSGSHQGNRSSQECRNERSFIDLTKERPNSNYSISSDHIISSRPHSSSSGVNNLELPLLPDQYSDSFLESIKSRATEGRIVIDDLKVYADDIMKKAKRPIRKIEKNLVKNLYRMYSEKSGKSSPFFGLGVLFVGFGEYKEAIWAYSKHSQLEPKDNSEIFYNIGLCYEYLGEENRSAAMDYFCKSASLGNQGAISKLANFPNYFCKLKEENKRLKSELETEKITNLASKSYGQACDLEINKLKEENDRIKSEVEEANLFYILSEAYGDDCDLKINKLKKEKKSLKKEVKNLRGQLLETKASNGKEEKEVVASNELVNRKRSRVSFVVKDAPPF